MANYRAPVKKNNNRFYILLVATVAVLLVAVSLLLVKAFRVAGDDADTQEGGTSVAESAVSMSDAATQSDTQPASSAAQIPVAVAQPSTVTVPWNVRTYVQRTLYNTNITPDFRMLAVPANGHVTNDYFNTCMFIGDSLSQGLAQYGTVKEQIGSASVCAYKSTSPRSFLDNATAQDVNRQNVPVWTDLTSHPVPRNIYILLGTNAIVGQDDDAVLHYYDLLLDQLQGFYAQYDTNIYVQMMTPVTQSTSTNRPSMDNDRIRGLNNYIAQLAVNKGMYVIDLQEALANESGCLPDAIAAGDGYHLTPEGYNIWLEYLRTHTVYDAQNPYDVPATHGSPNSAQADNMPMATIGNSGSIGASGETVGTSGETVGASGEAVDAAAPTEVIGSSQTAV